MQAAFDPDGTRVAPDIPCVDTWPPGTLTEASMHAYKRLDKDKTLKLQSVALNKQTGVITVRYLADPMWDHPWILDKLKETRAKIIEECSEQMKL